MHQVPTTLDSTLPTMQLDINLSVFSNSTSPIWNTDFLLNVYGLRAEIKSRHLSKYLGLGKSSSRVTKNVMECFILDLQYSM